MAAAVANFGGLRAPRDPVPPSRFFPRTLGHRPRPAAPDLARKVNAIFAGMGGRPR